MKELKGTKTEKNLMEAFAGESMARNKYSYWASKAKKDGFEQIAAIFEETANIGLKDAYIQSHAEHAMMEGVPLTTSHIVKGRGPVRYDHFFVRKEMNISKMEYHYEEAVAAESDHALLICDIGTE